MPSSSLPFTFWGIDLDDAGNSYIVGTTYGNLGEVKGGISDTFVAKFNFSGSLQWVTQLGSVTKPAGGDTSAQEISHSIVVKGATGDIYALGKTDSNFAETAGPVMDLFLFRLNNAGALTLAKQIGASTLPPGGSNNGSEDGRGITIDSSSNIYLTGQTTGDLGEANAGNSDAFIMKLNSSGEF